MLFYLMIKNHPFENGNKIIAVTALFTFLYMNGKWLEVNKQVLYNFAVWVAESPADLKDLVVEGIKRLLKEKLTSYKE